jgi:hypothetical protein
MQLDRMGLCSFVKESRQARYSWNADLRMEALERQQAPRSGLM